MSPRACEICVHPQQAEINKAIGAGETLRAIAKRFGPSTAGIQRHRTGHLGLPPKREDTSRPTEFAVPVGTKRFDSRAEITSVADLRDRLSVLFRLGDLLEEAFTKKDVDACVKIAREYRAAAETYAKVAGWLNEGSTTIVDQRRQTVQLFKDLTADELRALAAGATDNRELSTGRDVLSLSAEMAGEVRDQVHDVAFVDVSEPEITRPTHPNKAATDV